MRLNLFIQVVARAAHQHTVVVELGRDELFVLEDYYATAILLGVDV